MHTLTHALMHTHTRALMHIYHTHTQENYPGEYINFTVFNSNVPSCSTPPAKDPKPPLTAEPPSCPPNLPDEPKERFLDVIVDFKLHDITAEFPTVS